MRRGLGIIAGIVGMACASDPVAAGGDTDAGAPDAGEAPKLKLSGNLHFLQRDSVGIDNGGSVTTLTANGPFTLTQKIAAGSSYDVKVISQPAGQTCWVKNGRGTAGADVTDVDVRCAVAVQTRSMIKPGGVEYPSDILVPLDIDVATFATDIDADVLVTFVVPKVRSLDSPPPSTPVGYYGLTYVGIELDGYVVADGSVGEALWGGFGPISIASVVKVKAGNHQVKAVWKKETAPGRPVPARSILPYEYSLPLGATVLSSLSAVTDVAETTAADARTTADAQPQSIGPAPLAITTTESRPVLAFLQVPVARRKQAFFATLDVDGASIAGGRLEGTGVGGFTYPLTAIVATTVPPGMHTFEAKWKTDGTVDREASVPQDRKRQLAAMTLSPSAIVKTTSRTSAVNTTSKELVPIAGLDPLTLDVARPSKLLVTFTTEAVSVNGDHANGELDVLVDQTSVIVEHVHTEGGDAVHPATMFAIADVGPGTHTVTARFRYLDAYAEGTTKTIDIHDGHTSLTALVLE